VTGRFFSAATKGSVNERGIQTAFVPNADAHRGYDPSREPARQEVSPAHRLLANTAGTSYTASMQSLGQAVP